MKKPWILSMFFSLILLGVLFIGMWIGHYRVTQSFRNIIRGYQKSETLGSFVTPEQQKEIALAYTDMNILEEMDNISWDIPKGFTPFVGNAPLPGVHNNATINSDQFRSDKEIQLPKPADVFRIIITGGSTAYGSGAPSQQQTISEYLSELLNSRLSPDTNLNYEVLTFATPAWASTNERIAIENRISELEPDLVISISGNNDIHWGWRGRNILWFRTYSDELFFSLINKAYEMAGYPKLPDVTQIEPGPVSPTLVADRLIKNVILSSYALNLKNIPYFYFLQPTVAMTNKELTTRESEILSDPAEEAYYVESMTLFDDALSKLSVDNFHYTNLWPVFDEHSQADEIFIDRSHFGDKGYRIISEAIYSRISDFLQP